MDPYADVETEDEADHHEREIQAIVKDDEEEITQSAHPHLPPPTSPPPNEVEAEGEVNPPGIPWEIVATIKKRVRTDELDTSDKVLKEIEVTVEELDAARRVYAELRECLPSIEEWLDGLLLKKAKIAADSISSLGGNRDELIERLHHIYRKTVEQDVIKAKKPDLKVDAAADQAKETAAVVALALVDASPQALTSKPKRDPTQYTRFNSWEENMIREYIRDQSDVGATVLARALKKAGRFPERKEENLASKINWMRKKEDMPHTAILGRPRKEITPPLS